MSMWKGLGQRLKNFAEDLTTPPFIDDEEDEEDVGDDRIVARAGTQLPHRGNKEDVEALTNARGPSSAPRDAGGADWPARMARQGRSVADPSTDANSDAGFLFPRIAGNESAPPAMPAVRPPAATLQGQPSPPVAAESRAMGVGVSPSVRRLEEELNLATPATAAREAVPPQAARQGGEAALPGSPALRVPSASFTTAPSPPPTGERTETHPTADDDARLEQKKAEGGEREGDASMNGASPSHAAVESLQAQLHALEADKRRLTEDSRAQQQRAKELLDSTVASYEAQLSQMQAALANKDAEMVSLRDALATLQKERTDREKKDHLKCDKRDEEILAWQEKEVALRQELEGLKADAQEREQAFAEERTAWEARLASATESNTIRASSSETEKTRSLEGQVDQLQEEVAGLRHSLQAAQHALSEKESARSVTDRAISHSTSNEPSDTASATVGAPNAEELQTRATASSHLVKLVAAKDGEIQKLKAEVKQLMANQAEMEEQLNQLSDGYIKLDGMLEEERSAHKDDVQHRQEQLARSTEKSARDAARVMQLERLLAEKEEALRQLSNPPAKATADAPSQTEVPEEVAQKGQASKTDSQLQQAEAEEREKVLARLATAQEAEEANQKQMARLQEALAASEEILASTTRRFAEEQEQLRLAHEEALAKAEASWKAERDTAVSLAQEQQQREWAEAATAAISPQEAPIDPALLAELEALREENGALKGRVASLAAQLEEAAAEREALTSQHTQASEALVKAEADRDALKQRVAQAEKALRAAQEERHKEESSRQGADAVSLSALQTRVRELEAESERTDDVVGELQRSVVSCLTRNNNIGSSLPGDAGSGNAGELFDVKASKRFSFSDWVLTLTTALDRTAAIARKAGRLQHEWERTYEEARRVNETLNQQVSDAWGSIGQLQEERSIKEEQMRELAQRLHAGEEALAQSEQRVTQLTNELGALREEAGGEALSASPTGQEQEQQLQAAQVLARELQAEVGSLRFALQERDDELSVAQRSLENLNDVLESFKASRAQDVAERTTALQLEIDQLRAQLGSSSHAKEDFQRELDMQRAHYDQELSAKNMLITALHKKLSELRHALEDAAKQLNGESSIDKRVVSHILVNFIHGFVAQKKETDEILKVLSGLLHWDEDMQERVGLLPGPMNPQPATQQPGATGRRGLFSWVRGSGGGAREAGRSDAAGGASSRPARRPGGSDGGSSLASMWVDFLMQESEQRATEGGQPTSDATAEERTAAPPEPATATPEAATSVL